MRALYFYPHDRSFGLGEYPDDALPPGHARLRVISVGVCGSDIHSIENCEMGGVEIVSPYVLGHEFAGVIEALAPDVRGGPWAVGDRVAVDPQLPCLRCRFCLEGRENICPHMRFIGGYPLPGALREAVVLPVRNLYPLPAGVSLDAGVIVEPLAVALHAVRLGGPLIDASAAVIGAGPIGNLVLQCLRLQTGNTIVVSEPLVPRRELALRYRATAAVDPREESVDTLRRRWFGGYGPDVVFEATRNGEGLAAALELVRPGGRVVYIGIADDPVALKTSVPRRKEVTLQWVRRSQGCYPTAIELVARGAVEADALITHRVALSRGGDVMHTVMGYADGVLKALIDVTAE